MRGGTGQLVLLEVAPDPPIGVQLRTLAGEAMGIQSEVVVEEGLHELRPVGLPAVAED